MTMFIKHMSCYGSVPEQVGRIWRSANRSLKRPVILFSTITKVKKTIIVLDDKEHVVHSYTNRKFVLFFELDITDF